jgi:hypothetical protein
MSANIKHHFAYHSGDVTSLIEINGSSLVSGLYLSSTPSARRGSLPGYSSIAVIGKVKKKIVPPSGLGSAHRRPLWAVMIE